MDMEDVDVRISLAKLAMIAESLDARVDEILVQTTRTNGRLVAVERVSSVHDSQIAGLMSDYARIRDERSAFRSELLGAIASNAAAAKSDADSKSGDNRKISSRDVWMVTLGGGGVVTAWKFIEYVIRVLERAA
jgi:hypothetical protein